MTKAFLDMGKGWEMISRMEGAKMTVTVPKQKSWPVFGRVMGLPMPDALSAVMSQGCF
jgi:hypothetical protein